MKLKKFDSINVIPFIDVLLVLLAIVLLTSTFIAKEIIPVSLPTASSSNKLKQEKDIFISIKEDGRLYLEKNDLSLKDLEANILKLDKGTPININTDKNSKFESFVQVLDMLKSNDYLNISIITTK